MANMARDFCQGKGNPSNGVNQRLDCFVFWPAAGGDWREASGLDCADPMTGLFLLPFNR